jgi:hypothetical protein
MSTLSSRHVIERLYQAFQTGDVSTILSLMDPGVDWQLFGPDSIPYARPFHGREGVGQFFAAVGSAVEVLEFEPREFIVEAGQVVVLGRERVRVRATGRIFSTPWAHVFSVLMNGRVIRLRGFLDTAAVSAAFLGQSG